MRGGKDIENRSWRTSFRGRVAIHASARLYPADVDRACASMRAFVKGFSRKRFEREYFPLGAILGTVEITDCVSSSESPWFFGPYGLVLRDARPLPLPVPCKGALGLWRVDGRTAALIDPDTC